MLPRICSSVGIEYLAIGFIGSFSGDFKGVSYRALQVSQSGASGSLVAVSPEKKQI